MPNSLPVGAQKSNPEVNLGVYPEGMDVYEARRLALQQFIETRFAGNQSAFASESGLATSYVSRLLAAEGAKSRKRMGEDIARRLEGHFDLPTGTFTEPSISPRRGAEEGVPREISELIPDRRHAPGAQRGLVGAIALRLLDIEASMGRGVSQPGHDNVVMNMVVDENWLRRTATFSSPENLALVTGIGDSMRPTFEDGDPLLIDRAVTDIKLDAIYVLALNDELFIKRIQRRPDGSFLMISDNKSYEPYHITDGERQKFQVLGRVVMAWNSRRV
jgi:phage repressor protein C with HTH and peptisase S24 domain